MSKYKTIIANGKSYYYTWNEFIENNKGLLQYNIEWLKIIEETGKFELIPLMTYKQDKLVSIFPLFKKRMKLLNIIFSPPPKYGIPELGPLLKHNNVISYKNELENIRILNNQIDFLKKNIKYDFLKVDINRYIKDPRVFLWNNYKIKPEFTYCLDISIKEEDIFKSFDGRIRTSIRKALKDKEFKISFGDKSDFFEIVSQVRKRYKDQGKKYSLSDLYLEKIYDSFKKNIIVITAKNNSNVLLSGLIIPFSKELGFHWIGGVNFGKKIQGVNESLHWEAIRYLKKKDIYKYELMGANTFHLCEHKSRYNPMLVQYYTMASTKKIFTPIINLLY